jgi:hypothetical protein
MSLIWHAVSILLFDQRVGEMSSRKQRRAEQMATGMPSARCGGKEVGLSGRFPEPERSVIILFGVSLVTTSTIPTATTRKEIVRHGPSSPCAMWAHRGTDLVRQREVVRLQTVCTRRREWCRRLVSM